MTKAGYQVTLEVDGAKGLQLAQTDEYDIILLDLMVPNVTGIEILRALRDPARAPHLKPRLSSPPTSSNAKTSEPTSKNKPTATSSKPNSPRTNSSTSSTT